MTAIHLETVVKKDGTLILRGLPSLAGHCVDVLVKDLKKGARRDAALYPLRNVPVQYKDPFESVAEGDWDVLS